MATTTDRTRRASGRSFRPSSLHIAAAGDSPDDAVGQRSGQASKRTPIPAPESSSIADRCAELAFGGYVPGMPHGERRFVRLAKKLTPIWPQLLLGASPGIW